MNGENANESQLKLFEPFNSKRTSLYQRTNLHKYSSGVPLKQNKSLSKISISQTSSEMNNPSRQFTDIFQDPKAVFNQSDDLSVNHNYQTIKQFNHYRQKKKSLDNTKRPSLLCNFEQIKNINTLAKISKKTFEKSHYGSLLNKLKIYDYIIGALSIVCIIVAIAYSEHYSIRSFDYITKLFEEENKEFTRLAFQFTNQRIITLTENIFATINLLISLILCVVIYFRYVALMKLFINEDRLCEYDNLLSSGLIKQLIRDEILAIIFVPPYMNTGYTLFVGKTQVSVISLNHILSICQLLKLNFAVRAITQFSKWNSPLAMGICSNLHVQNNNSFKIKCEMAYRPLLFLPCTILIALLIFMAIIRPFEFLAYKDNGNSKNKELKTQINCMWIVIEAMLKIGYGEYTLNSFLCSIAIFFAYLFGSSFFGFFIYSLYQLIKFNVEEEKAFAKLNKLFSADNIEHKAVGVIKYLLFLKKLQKKQDRNIDSLKINRKEKYHLLLMLAKYIKNFKNEYTVSDSYFMPITELLIRTQERVYCDVNEFNEILSLYGTTENDLAAIRANQEDIQESLQKIKAMYRKVMKYIIKENNNKSILNQMKKPKIDGLQAKAFLFEKNAPGFLSFSGLPIKTQKTKKVVNSPSNYTKESQTPKPGIILQKRKKHRNKTIIQLASKTKSNLIFHGGITFKIHSLHSMKKLENNEE